jgi:hypothetical protein
VIEALRTSILEPRDHLHIKQKSATAQGQMIAGKQRRTAGNNRAV